MSPELTFLATSTRSYSETPGAPGSPFGSLHAGGTLRAGGTLPRGPCGPCDPRRPLKRAIVFLATLGGVTAPFFNCAAPTLFFGSLTAA